jgi:penicillin-insensitive murein endopeptidase
MRHISLALLILILSFNGAAAKAKHKAKKPAGPPSPIARDLFGVQKLPSPGEPRPIGSSARGCLAGAKPLPIDGPNWQVMRLSRNRNWGHPSLINYIEKLSADANKTDGWPGLLIGDLAQPMGGPMVSDHASHQTGLDADIWLTPMPTDKRLTPQERNTMPMASVLAADGVSVDASKLTTDSEKLIKRAASYPEVALVFVNPAIKKALCSWSGNDKAWLAKVRPWWGHDDHFHVRLSCPPKSPGCVNQPLRNSGDGCGKEVDSWLKKMRKPAVQPPAPPPVAQSKPGRAIRLSALPVECTKLLGAAAKSPLPAVPGEPIPLPERKPAQAGKTAEKKTGGG